MADVVLNEKLLSTIAGWEAMKHARAYLEAGQVLSSNWTPPVLKGVVQAGGTEYRAGLVIRSATDVENMCSCRDSRQWGTICAHSVSVGLHHLRPTIARPAAPGSRPIANAPTASSSGPGTSSTAATHPAAATVPTLRFAEADADAIPLAIHVILPQSFSEGLARNKATLFFEAETNGRRQPLNVVPRSRPFRCDSADRSLLSALLERTGGQLPAMLTVSASEFADLLSAATGHPRITLAKQQPIEVAPSSWKPKVQATLHPDGEISLRLPPLPERTQVLVGTTRTWIFGNLRFQPLDLPAALQPALAQPIRLPRAAVPAFLTRDYPGLQTACDLEANFRLDQFSCETTPPRFILSLQGGLTQLRAHLQCAYGSRIYTVGAGASDDGAWLPDPDSPTRYLTRDPASERAALSRLLKYGFSHPDSRGHCQIAGEDRVLNFLAREFPRLEKEWTVTLEERLQRATAKDLEHIEPEFKIIPSGERWFDLEITFGTGADERFSAADIQQLLLSGRSHKRLKNGKLALIDTGAVEELQQVLLDCSPQQRDGRYRLDNTQAAFLQTSLQDAGFQRIQSPPQWRPASAANLNQLPLPPLADLDTVLRPYQKKGVAWLWFLRNNQFGGILADEMGLGKTLQTLAVLAAARDGSRSGAATAPAAPSLIVCPTSLVFNWAAEARRFTPQLKVLVLDGPRRQSRFPLIPRHDLVVTSYTLLRRDTLEYQPFEFDTVVLDEAQHIKNRESQNAQSVKRIRASHRLVLTGTPLENSVLDLWSIFDFLMPGYLGPAKDFRERYELPIVRDRDTNAQARLNRRLRPFLLRRLKRDVAKELPEKIEQVALCDLTPPQQAAYSQVLNTSRQEVLAAIGANGLARSRMLIFTTLLRLRQICCDLRLLKLPGEPPPDPSGKLDLFSELLDEILDGGHRALVFSQFVEMLTLLREHLDTAQVPYCYLDGSTRNRQEVIDRFQSGDAPVFLISLKAGGTGLNLTAADTVVHFDPWWNPAVEDQATGRAHRIGQNRVVTSYKLIARGTLEEKILNLQQRKRDIADATLTGEDALAENFSWEDIQGLLAD